MYRGSSGYHISSFHREQVGDRRGKWEGGQSGGCYGWWRGCGGGRGHKYYQYTGNSTNINEIDIQNLAYNYSITEYVKLRGVYYIHTLKIWANFKLKWW